MLIRRFSGLAALVVTLWGCGGGSGAPINDAALTGRLEPALARILAGGEAALQSQDFSAASVYADSLIEAAPELADGFFLRGRVFSELNQFDEARKAYEKAVELNPSFRRAWFRLGNDQLVQGQSEKAVAFYEKERAVIAETPKARRRLYEHIDKEILPALHVQIGRAYKLLNRPDDARRAYHEALALDSTWAEAHSWLGELESDAGNYEIALRHALKSVELEPEQVEYRYRAGSLLNRTGKPREALGLLQGVVQQDPWHEAANYNLGQVLLRLGEPEAGQYYLARVDSIKQVQHKLAESSSAVHKQPDSPSRWTQLGSVLIQLGKYDEARRALGAAAHLQPGNVAVQNDLANLSLALGDTMDAVRRFNGILRMDSTQADVWLNLGVVYAMTGRYEDARQAWLTTLKYAPQHPDATVYLQRLPADS